MRDSNNKHIEIMHGVCTVEEELSAGNPVTNEFIEGLRGLGDKLGVDVGSLLDIICDNNNVMEK